MVNAGMVNAGMVNAGMVNAGMVNAGMVNAGMVVSRSIRLAGRLAIATHAMCAQAAQPD